MDVNERIRALMEERGWTPYRLAKESGLSEGTVGNIFRRNTVPSTATLQAICGGLKITLSQFFAEGEMIELTPELKELFGDWVNLTADQKDAVRHMIPKRQMGCDSQLTVKPRKNSASLVDIILFSSCQMHPTKQEVHPTFRPVHSTCRIVSKWPTFSKSKQSAQKGGLFLLKSADCSEPSGQDNETGHVCFCDKHGLFQRNKALAGRMEYHLRMGIISPPRGAFPARYRRFRRH